MTAKEIQIWNAALDAAIRECHVWVEQKRKWYGARAKKPRSFNRIRGGAECAVAIEALKRSEQIQETICEHQFVGVGIRPKSYRCVNCGKLEVIYSGEQK